MIFSQNSSSEELVSANSWHSGCQAAHRGVEAECSNISGSKRELIGGRMSTIARFTRLALATLATWACFSVPETPMPSIKSKTTEQDPGRHPLIRAAMMASWAHYQPGRGSSGSDSQSTR
jgi:hypothetical protein